MTIAYTKLPGLNRDQLVEVVEPVLRAHRVVGVELVWRGDKKGQVLELTVERPDSPTPGAGVTIETCSEISRDLSAALDVADIIQPAYRLEVGTPGLDRALHTQDDFRRFAGQLVKIKLEQPFDASSGGNQRTVRGTLFGYDDEGRIQVETDTGTVSLDFENIIAARLVFDWKRSAGGASRPHSSGAKNRKKRSK